MNLYWKGIKDFFDENTLDFFPIRKAIRDYSWGKLRHDIHAAVNVALLDFPQGMAYALVAGLPVQYGMYTAIIASLIGALFSGSRFMTQGPTNGTAIMVMSAFTSLQLVDDLAIQYMPVFLSMIGLFLIIGSLLRITNITRFISNAVIFGYTTAAAILVIANQVHFVLGYKIRHEGDHTITFYDVCKTTFQLIHLSHIPSIIIGFITFFVFWLARRYSKRLPHVAVVIIIMTCIATLFREMHIPLAYLKPFDASLWKISIPNWSFDAIGLLANPALALSFLCMLESTSIGKSLGAKAGEHTDLNQIVFSVGMANLCCSFTSGMPASGSFLRSTVSLASGAATSLTAFFSALLCILAVFVVVPFIGYIPQAALSAIIIYIGFSLINKHAIKILTTATSSDAIVFAITLFSGLLFPLSTAIFYGVIFAVILFLRKASKPEMLEYSYSKGSNTLKLASLASNQEASQPEISLFHIGGNLFFGSSDLFYGQIRHVCERPNLRIIILKMRNVYVMDATCVMALEELILLMQKTQRQLLISEVRPPMLKILRNSGLTHLLGFSNIFVDDVKNSTASTSKALKRAREILGQPATIRIYTNPTSHIPTIYPTLLNETPPPTIPQKPLANRSRRTI
ncbi:MAG: hypothetical protein A2007_03050 [Verrucomicrobia bacterium GWC2_42_7]|nr:MAG: hypothetical protein A2007_03050 [Verrucomicrobia bacterium GWC2_42_7]